MNFGEMQQICIAGAVQWHDNHYRDLAPLMWGEPKRPNTITNKTKWKKKRRNGK